jgi:23S rRNA (uracil1939-C5)-methyltransferase
MDAAVEDLASVAWMKGGKIVPLAGKRTINDIIRTELAVLKTEVSPQSFYQVNPRQTEKLYGIVQRYAALTGGETVLDLYCGAGSIGLSMAGSCRRVIGVESVRPAVLDANRNAVINGIVNAEFICGKAEDIVPKRLQGINADVVILDPPRSGCKASLLQCVKDIAPERLIYVSCDPATLARDLKILADAFSFVEATPVDMFPHTRHVETVVLLSRENK